VKAALAWCVP